MNLNWTSFKRPIICCRYTYHGGCPVLAGSKWITNKWIRSRAQFQLYPCKGNLDHVYRMKPLDNDVCK